jgi:hypothetical protein
MSEIRKFMNLMESSIQDEKLNEGLSLVGLDTDLVLEQIFQHGHKHGVSASEGNMVNAKAHASSATKLIKDMVETIGPKIQRFKTNEQIDEAIQYDSLSRALWKVYQAGQAGNEAQAQDIISDILDAVLRPVQQVEEDTTDNPIRSLPIYSTFVDASRNMSKEDLLDVIVDAWRNGNRITPKTLNRRNPG